MNKSGLGLLAVVLLSGCAESARETKLDKEAAPIANAPESLETESLETESLETRSDQTAAADPPARAEASSPIDAATLLASTLEKAKAENKRVMVHIGAPG